MSGTALSMAMPCDFDKERRECVYNLKLLCKTIIKLPTTVPVGMPDGIVGCIDHQDKVLDNVVRGINGWIRLQRALNFSFMCQQVMGLVQQVIDTTANMASPKGKP
ncbi:hypothetical protein BS47DRAFT_1366373 [Hydnum rufescens UP504]|uniref:Uncharacterized protein n=1 Tax=Hydnum rufescens UP504 TaxID=1448309 RepID=A0A9P6DMC7_9AGAM|nr:hypothetical protein BS47DRAFT_1366373 [Hydnum rufescens UP504]